MTGIVSLTKELDEFELAKTEARAVTGVLASHPNSTDVHISSLSLTFHGQELLADTSLELNSGRRYGLIGLNGTGKLFLLLLVSDLDIFQDLLNATLLTHRTTSFYTIPSLHTLLLTDGSCPKYK